MADKPSLREGALAVVQASSVTLATLVFLPGVLVRVACQVLAAALCGMRVAHRDFVTDLGGEVEYLSGNRKWSRMLIGTVAGPLLIGAILLLPTIVRTTLLDVRPFASISSDPRVVLSHSTSYLPFLDALARFGTVEFLRLWFGVSCFYCCVPSSVILEETTKENHTRPRWSPLRLTLGSLIGFFRLLRAIDALLTLGFAGTYLASGLIVLLLSWRLLASLAHLLF